MMTKTKKAFIYVFEGMADWEFGFLAAELNSGRYFKEDRSRIEVRTVATEVTPVLTMGGIWILPDLSLEELDPKDALLLVLPGGEGWLDESHALAIAKAAQFLSAGVIVAAICGATLGLGAAGLLDNRDHTSNDLGYMKAVCPAYRGETKYREEPAVFDGGLITASGIAPVEFAGLVLESLDLVDHDALDGWLGLYRSHESRYYFQLMESLPKMKSA